MCRILSSCRDKNWSTAFLRMREEKVASFFDGRYWINSVTLVRLTILTDSRGILWSISCWTESSGRARTLPLLKKDVILWCITSFSVFSCGCLGRPLQCNCESAAFSSALITFLNASQICTRSPIEEMSSLHSSSENFTKVDPATWLDLRLLITCSISSSDTIGLNVFMACWTKLMQSSEFHKERSAMEQLISGGFQDFKSRACAIRPKVGGEEWIKNTGTAIVGLCRQRQKKHWQCSARFHNNCSIRIVEGLVHNALNLKSA